MSPCPTSARQGSGWAAGGSPAPPRATAPAPAGLRPRVLAGPRIAPRVRRCRLAAGRVADAAWRLITPSLYTTVMRTLAPARGYWIAAVLTGLALAGGPAIFLARPISPAVEERDGTATLEVAPLLKDLDLIRPSRPQAAKEFSVPTLAGTTLRLADYRGKGGVLDFWATWGPPCTGGRA